MSQVDDILFAPISLVSDIDFQIRHRMRTISYDWKPVSKRAHDWCRSWFPISYRARFSSDWMNSFTTHHFSQIQNREDLFLKDFVFEEVSS
jgi:uncharacterized radical SAM superfamily Fe-S cluster-containing enzyme